MRLFRGVLAWHTALASSRQSALCVVFEFLHATATTKTLFLARIWLSKLHHACPRYPTERENAGTSHPHVPTPPRRRWRALGGLFWRIGRRLLFNGVALADAVGLFDAQRAVVVYLQHLVKQGWF